MLRGASWSKRHRLHTVKSRHAVAQTSNASGIDSPASNRDGGPHMGGGQTHCPLASIANAPAILAGCSDHTSLTNLPAHLPEKQQASCNTWPHSLGALQQSCGQQSGNTWLMSLEGEKRSSAWRDRLYRMSKGRALTLLTLLFRALHAN